MAKKSSIAEILNGLKETFSVVVLKGDVQTDFQPHQNDCVPDENTPPVSVDASTLPKNCSLSIDEHYRTLITDFIRSHNVNDVIEVPCVYNHNNASALICSTPRLFSEDLKVHDVVSILLFTRNGFEAQADYGIRTDNIEREFDNDMQEHGHATTQEARSAIVDKLTELFPGVNFDDSEPVIFEEPTEEKKGETI